jgi:tetratricopeptide (TPR) repeat protein
MRVGFLLAGLLMGAAPAAAAMPAAYAGAEQPAARKQLDSLFAALAKAGSEEEAQPIEEQIVTAFLQSGSDSVDLLMSRAAEALQGGDIGTAKKLFMSVTDIAPDFAEGWHQRGRIEAAAGEDEAAMVSLQKAVTLNPRQFQAYAELGGMLEEYGDKSGALVMYRKAQALDPNLDDVARHVRELTRAVEGERI